MFNDEVGVFAAPGEVREVSLALLVWCFGLTLSSQAYHTAQLRCQTLEKENAALKRELLTVKAELVARAGAEQQSRPKKTISTAPYQADCVKFGKQFGIMHEPWVEPVTIQVPRPASRGIL